MNKKLQKLQQQQIVKICQLGRLRYLREEAKRLGKELDEMCRKADIYAVYGTLKEEKNECFKVNKADILYKDKQCLEQTLTENLHKIIKERMRLEKIVNGISDDEARIIVRLRIINGLTWDEIGEAIHMDRRTVARKFQNLTGYFISVNDAN